MMLETKNQILPRRGPIIPTSASESRPSPAKVFVAHSIYIQFMDNTMDGTRV